MSNKIQRTNKPFVVKAPYNPSGDQPQAIDELANRIENGENDVVLMGATGTGKTATTAWLIERNDRLLLLSRIKLWRLNFARSFASLCQIML